MVKKAIILYSGGLDSTTCLAIAKSQGFSCFALSFTYGQRHSSEIIFAKRFVTLIDPTVQFKVLHLPLDQIGGSSLTDLSITIPTSTAINEIPNTYVPARNTIFLSFALAIAETIKAYDIFIGANCIDYSQYPDCRPAYLSTFEKLAMLATKQGSEKNSTIKIHAPLLHMTKAEIIKTGINLGVNYQHTVSCYQADTEGKACGICDSCKFRRKGFQEAGIADPTNYQS